MNKPTYSFSSLVDPVLCCYNVITKEKQTRPFNLKTALALFKYSEKNPLSVICLLNMGHWLDVRVVDSKGNLISPKNQEDAAEFMIFLMGKV